MDFRVIPGDLVVVCDDSALDNDDGRQRQESLYLCFDTENQRNQVAKLLDERVRATKADLHGPGKAAMLSNILSDAKQMTSLWQAGQLSNFHYLDFLNCAAGI